MARPPDGGHRRRLNDRRDVIASRIAANDGEGEADPIPIEPEGRERAIAIANEFPEIHTRTMDDAGSTFDPEDEEILLPARRRTTASR
jgi:hypothetical protein